MVGDLNCPRGYSVASPYLPRPVGVITGLSVLTLDWAGILSCVGDDYVPCL